MANARHFGARAYENIRHGLVTANRVIDTSAHLYGGVIQPLLNQQFGVDTRQADHALMDAYQNYNTVRDAAHKIHQILQN